MTTHKVLRIPITDLELVRLSCVTCKATLELAIVDVGKHVAGPACRICGTMLFHNAQASSLLYLANAIADVVRDKDRVVVELVLPASRTDRRRGRQYSRKTR